MLSNNKQYVICTLILPFFSIIAICLFYNVGLREGFTSLLALSPLITFFILMAINLVFLYKAECRPLYSISAITNYLPHYIIPLAFTISLFITMSIGNTDRISLDGFSAGLITYILLIPAIIILSLFYIIIEIKILVMLILDLETINEKQKNHEPENNTTKELGIKQKIFQYHFLIPVILLIPTIALYIYIIFFFNK